MSDPSKKPIPLQITGALFDGLTRGSLRRRVVVAGSFLAAGLRFPGGMLAGPQGARPERMLVLFDEEASGESRVVREALSELDLDAELRPCPRGGKRFRTDGLRVPTLLDPNTGTELAGAEAILAHLYSRYGVKRPFLLRNVRPFVAVSAPLIHGLRGGRGRHVRRSRAPEKPLELWAFEASPYCALVRETLCELELPWLLHNVAKRSPRRDAFVSRSGRMMVPWLFDPNTGAQMFESADIVRYLESTYGEAAPALSKAG